MPALATIGTRLNNFNKKLFHSLRSRGILSSLLFAFALWMYVSLNNTFSIFLTIPVEIKTNDNQAIETELPHYITVEIKGKGWDLFNAKYLSQSQECLIDISNYANSPSSIEFPYTKIAHSLRAMEQFEIKSISPESFTIRLSEVAKAVLPIQSKMIITPRYGFTQVGEVGFEPKTVLAKGHSTKLDSFKSFPTYNLQIKDAYSDVSGNIPISDTLFPVVKVTPVSVKYFAKIQYNCVVKFEQVPLKIRGGALTNGNNIQPKYITVYFTGGVEELAKIIPEDISVYIDYDKIMNDTTGSIIPTVDMPSTVKLLKTEPPYIYHYKYVSGLLISQF